MSVKGGGCVGWLYCVKCEWVGGRWEGEKVSNCGIRISLSAGFLNDVRALSSAQ